MFKDTLRFSPVITEGFSKAHPASVEYRDWWFEQRKRCLEGYSVDGVRITGDHYWYLNFWKIRGVTKQGRKGLVEPRFTDLDFEFFHAIEQARLAGKNFVVAKPRQKGFSEKLASLAGKEFSLFKNSQTVIVAGEQKYADNTMRMTLRGLNSLKDTEFYKRKNPDTLEFVQARYKSIEDGTTVWRGSLSEIRNITAKNSAQAASGLSPNLVIMEEVGIFPLLIETYKFIQPMIETNGVKTGFVIIVGTGGDMDSGAEQLQKMFYNPQAYDLMEFEDIYSGENIQRKIGYFVPAWKFEIIDKEGNSLQEPSVEMLLKKREDAARSSDSESFFKTIIQKPLVPDECFMISSGNRFPLHKINARIAELRTTRGLDKLGERGYLEWVRDHSGFVQGVKFVSDESGPFIIFEHPEIDPNTSKAKVNTYIAGTDSYDKDDAATSSSKGSCQIYKMFSTASATYKKFIARITIRPHTADEFYEMSAKMCMYYQARNLIEWSNVQIFGWYKRNNLEWLLKERPQVAYANVKQSKVVNKYGIDPSTKEYWITAYRDYLIDHCDKIDDIEQLEAAAKYREEKDYNCDITISSALCIVHETDYLKIQKDPYEETQDWFFSYKTDKRGNLVSGFKKPLNQDPSKGKQQLKYV